MFRIALTILSICFLSIGFSQLSGNYTVNPTLPITTSNYHKMSAVVSNLVAAGVSGPVIVNVAQGTYVDSLYFTAIAGSSASNTITFQADPTNTAPVILTNAALGTTDGTIKFSACANISFNNMQIKNTGASFSRAVYFTGQVNSIYFNNCEFSGTYSANSSSTNYALIFGSASFIGGTGFHVNNCSGGNASHVFWAQGSGSNMHSRISITNSEFSNYSGQAVYTTFTDTLNVVGNTFEQALTSITTYGIYHTAGFTFSRFCNIQGNTVSCNSTGTTYGIFVSGCNASASQPSQIINNIVYTKSSTLLPTRYGIYLFGNNNVNVYHNTVSIANGSFTSARCLYVLDNAGMPYPTAGHAIRNNIFVNLTAGGTNGSCVNIATGAIPAVTALSNNLYYAPGSINPFTWGTNYADYATWSVSSGDANSVEGDPIFVSNSDFHVLGILANDAAFNLPNVLSDIDGDTRPIAGSTIADIGADEYTPGGCAQPVNLVWTAGDTTTASFSWIGDASATSWVLEYGPVGFTPGTGTLFTTTVNPATLTNLIPNSYYDIYVSANCGIFSSSITGPVFFNTFNQAEIMEVENECYSAGFMDISATGTQHVLLNDGIAAFTLPFPFLFQNDMVTTVAIQNNGAVLFNSFTNQAGPGNIDWITTGSGYQGLYPFWDDLDDAGGFVYHQQIGVAPNRKFIVQWNKHHDFYTSGNPFVFQVVIEETSNEIYYTYENTVSGSNSYTNGQSATIGLMGPSQNFPLSFNNVSYLSNHDCVHFYYTTCPKVNDVLTQYILPNEAGFSWESGGAGPTPFTVIFGPQGFDPSVSGTIINTTDSSVILIGLTENTNYDVYFYSNCGPTDSSRAVLVSFITPPLCSNPASFTAATAIDTVILDWAWNQYSTINLDHFELTYDWINFDPTTSGTTLNSGTLTSDTIVNPAFVAGGVYQIYVQAICGTDSSNLIGPLTFVMPISNDSICDAQELLVDGTIYYLNNTGATVQTNESLIAPPLTGAQTTTGWADGVITHSVWFEFVAPPSGNMRIDGTNSTFNGQVAVYEPGNCSPIENLVLVAANDNDLDDSLHLAPNFTLCGLTPGAVYHLLFDSYYNIYGLYSLQLSPIDLNAGNSLTSTTYCSGDTVNLFSGISNYPTNGTWIDLDTTGQIFDTNYLLSSNLAYNTPFEFAYVQVDGCASDTAISTFEFAEPPHAGTPVSYSICKNEPGNLFLGLTGTVTPGGQWFDPNGNFFNTTGLIPWGYLFVPGNYNFQYVVGNAFCPDISVTVTVIVEPACDFGLSENNLQYFTVSPNPNDGQIIIQTEQYQGMVNLLLSDAQGKEILRKKEIMINSISLDISAYENGVYFLQLVTENGTQVLSLVKGK